MKTMLKTVTLISGFIFVLVFMTANYTQAQDSKPWDIPAKYKAMKSTFKAGDKEALADGKMMWSKYCKSCHGSKGLGDGPKSAMLKTFPGDFSSEEFQGGTDGELYYKSFVGRDEMPNYEKKIVDDEDRWAIINYIRTMK